MSDIPRLSVVTFRKGTYILVEGKQAEQRFFIMKDGFVKITRLVQAAKEKGKSVIGPGGFIGLVSAVARKNQIETALALTDVVLMVVPLSQFKVFVRDNPDLAMKMIQQFSNRMRELNNSLISISFNTENTGSKTSALFLTGEFYMNSKMYQEAAYVFKRYTECYPEGEFITEAAAYLKKLESHVSFAVRAVKNNFLYTYEKDSIIFAEGETGHSLYVIQNGSVKITKIVNGSEIILSILKQGDIFGEMALLENKMRSATAIAKENGTVLMEMSKRNFGFLANRYPEVITRLTAILSKRIWFSYKQLSNALIKDPVGRAYNYLAIILEKNNIRRTDDTVYNFDFGPEELMKMAVIPGDQRTAVTQEILKSGAVSLHNNGRLFSKNVFELFKLGDYHKRIHIRQAGKEEYTKVKTVS
ncbi:MAG: Crp/Fnr family transcriptional regulator [Spirochaetaceae bacterium]|nr:Crp/Fnr family transcriptional regulator [Spirochaetaceae bacterium]